ncbi:MAG TPA: hypothetical protein VF271_07075 [Rhodanobacteraceae bacterium]
MVQYQFNGKRHHAGMWGRNRRHAWWCLLLLGWALIPGWAAAGPGMAAGGGGAPAQTQPDDRSTPVHISLEQAVARVQRETHGKVLRAGQRQFGHMIEYRIKVLTPDGHVRVVSVRTPMAPAATHKPKETR